MPHITIPYAPRKAFRAYHASRKRFFARAVHRRGGKTISMLNHKVRMAIEDPVAQLAGRGIRPKSQVEANGWREMPRLYSAIYPSLKQAKAIAWGPLKYYTKAIPGAKPNEAELSVTLPNASVVRLFGSGPTERDSFRGLKQWGVDFDEWQDVDPNVWHEMVRPSCVDTQAPVGFQGTIKGKNHMYRLFQTYKDDPDWFLQWLPASQSGILTPEFLATERADYEKEGKLLKFLQEYELEPMAVIEGAIFGKEYFWLKENGRIVPFAADPNGTIDTYWDLGMADYLVVLFVQRAYGQSMVVDCMATHRTSIPEVCRDLRKKGYRFGTHYLPHDAKVKDLTSGETREQSVRIHMGGMGDVRVIERVKAKGDAISMVRALHRRLWINEALETFIDAFAQYEQEYDEKRKVYLDFPKHNWCSHYADALELWAQREMREFGPTSIIVPHTTQSTAHDVNSAL